MCTSISLFPVSAAVHLTYVLFRVDDNLQNAVIDSVLQNSSFSRLDLFNWSARHRDSRSDVSTVLTDGEMPLFIDTELSPVPTDFATSPVFDVQTLKDISSSVEVIDENVMTTVSFVDSRRARWSDGVRSRIVSSRNPLPPGSLIYASLLGCYQILTSTSF